MRLKITSPATSANLGAGFDTLGVALSLKNEFILSPSKFEVIEISGFSSEVLALHTNNFFINIFKSTLAKLGINEPTLSYKITNNIPLSRGLGSSSSVIIAAIGAAFAWAKKELDYEQILKLSLEYEPHTDNTAPCLLGGFVISGLKPIKYEVDENIKAIIATPFSKISTSDSRKALKTSIELNEAISNIQKSSLIAACFSAKDYANLEHAWGDNIHQSARMQVFNELYLKILNALKSADAFSGEANLDLGKLKPKDALFMALSGSGSSFLTLANKENAPKMKDALLKLSELEAVFSLNLSNEGLKIECF